MKIVHYNADTFNQKFTSNTMTVKEREIISNKLKYIHLKQTTTYPSTS
ncbi:hypothetical protein [Bergeyella zoohelcum]|nr:hypothetical protein [Bergeyella zoohelcum]